ncbi:hypothetical protein EB118_04150 [bacterium]|nr:hypothetical protein [bacterium]
MKNTYNSSKVCSFCNSKERSQGILLKGNADETLYICQECIHDAVATIAIELKLRRDRFNQPFSLKKG